MGKHAGAEASLLHELGGFVVEYRRAMGHIFHSLTWKPTGKHRAV